MNNKKRNEVFAFLKLALVNVGRFLTVAVVIFSVAYLLHYARTSSYGADRFPTAEIEYLGVEYVDQRALDTLLRRSLPANLLQIDLEHVRRIVESEPWVRSVTVRRVLPGRLILILTERQAAAVATIDGELYVVDAEGAVLDRYGSRYQALDGPIVKGLRNLAREDAREDNIRRMQAYQRVIEEFKRSTKDHLAFISEINVENPARIALVPAEDPIPVFVGDAAFLKRYELFLSSRSLYEQLKSQYTIEYVDVTFENKIIFHTPERQQRQAVSREGS